MGVRGLASIFLVRLTFHQSRDFSATLDATEGSSTPDTASDKLEADRGSGN
jgi:hypothetical protein